MKLTKPQFDLLTRISSHPCGRAVRAQYTNYAPLRRLLAKKAVEMKFRQDGWAVIRTADAGCRALARQAQGGEE